MNERRSTSWILQHTTAGVFRLSAAFITINFLIFDTCCVLTTHQFCSATKTQQNKKLGRRCTGGIDKNVISSRQRWIVKFIWKLQSQAGGARRYFFNNSSLRIRECGVFIPVWCESGMAKLRSGAPALSSLSAMYCSRSSIRAHAHSSLTRADLFPSVRNFYLCINYFQLNRAALRRAFSLWIYVALVQKKSGSPSIGWDKFLMSAYSKICFAERSGKNMQIKLSACHTNAIELTFTG